MDQQKAQVAGATVAGYVGRCITNGTATFEDIHKLRKVLAVMLEG